MARNRIRQLVLLVGIAAPAGIAAAVQLHTPEELFRTPVIRDAALSPDGKRAAIALGAGKSGDLIMIVDADRLGQADAARKLSLFEPGRLRLEWIGWANDSRLLFGARIRSSGEMKDLGFRPGARIDGPYSRRVMAIDPDGSHAVMLFGDEKRLLRHTYDLSTVVDYTPSDPQHIIMTAWSGTGRDLYQVDVYNGKATRIARGSAKTIGWETEDGRPALRYDTNKRRSVVFVFGRDAQDEDDWSLIVRYRVKEDTQDWSFAGDAPGPGKIYVRSRPEGANTDGIYAYDIPTKTRGELVAQRSEYDMLSALLIDGQYAGAVYIADRYTYLLQDRQLQRHFDAIEAYFKGEANVLIHGIDRARTRMLIYSEGARSPGDYYLYDMRAAKLDFLVSARPWLEPQKLAGMEIRKSPMRDGTTITSYLTRPLGKTGPLPLVVVPHGGPEARDHVAFDPQVQALAAQGWLVLQPNFRGSDGYGRAFAEAGHRQWSRRMQDDVTDAVSELIASGTADRNRIAIFGSSYGGYAALAGAVVTPDLYRAAVSRAGPGNLLEMLKYERREEGADSEAYLYWTRSIGDPGSDREAIEAASPELHAARIRIPVLLAHGTGDEVVPIEQSRRMQRALEKAGRTVELIEFDDEAHSGWSAESSTHLLDEVIAFLEPVLDSPEAPDTEAKATAASTQ